VNYKELGLSVLLYRKRHNLHQLPFATAAGMSRNYLVMIEKGHATGLSVEKLVDLARAMETDPRELLGILMSS